MRRLEAKSRFTFPALGPKMMIHILKRKKKEKNRTVSYYFTTPFPQCLTSSTSLFVCFGPPTHYMQIEPFHFQNRFKAKTLDLVLPPRKQKQSAARAGERFPPPASPTADTPHYPTPPPLIPSESESVTRPSVTQRRRRAVRHCRPSCWKRSDLPLFVREAAVDGRQRQKIAPAGICHGNSRDNTARRD